MLTAIWIWVAYVIGCFLIGRPMGKKSLALWEKGKEIKDWNGGFWGFVLFPMSYDSKDVGSAGPNSCPIGFDFSGLDKPERWGDENKKKYLALNFLLWPVRILWNLFIQVIYIFLMLPIMTVYKLVVKIM